MGNPAAERAAEGPSSHTRATFSGATAFIGVLTLLITIISAAVPHWGSYSPTNQFFQRGATGKTFLNDFWVAFEGFEGRLKGFWGFLGCLKVGSHDRKSFTKNSTKFSKYLND